MSSALTEEGDDLDLQTIQPVDGAAEEAGIILAEAVAQKPAVPGGEGAVGQGTRISQPWPT